MGGWTGGPAGKLALSPAVAPAFTLVFLCEEAFQIPPEASLAPQRVSQLPSACLRPSFLHLTPHLCSTLTSAASHCQAIPTHPKSISALEEPSMKPSRVILALSGLFAIAGAADHASHEATATLTSPNIEDPPWPTICISCNNSLAGCMVDCQGNECDAKCRCDIASNLPLVSESEALQLVCSCY